MLNQLIPELASSADIYVSGISDDSRHLKKGDLFLAVSGAQYQARDFFQEAASKQVSAIVCEPPYEGKTSSGVPVFTLENLGKMRSEIAGRFYLNPSETMFVVAVTGTNGKTSCSHFIASALNKVGKNCGVVGTIGSGFEGELENPGLTTPGAIALQKLMFDLREHGAEALSLEASSHGLVQGRLSGVQVDVAVFTNLTRDHLDYHETFSNYKKAKQVLFDMDCIDTAIVNIDDDFGKELCKEIKPRINLLTFSIENNAANVWVKQLSFHEQGFNALVITPWGEMEISSPLMGVFNVSNLLVVIAVLGQQGYSKQSISAAVSKITNVKGRMDLLPNTGGISVLIDYAHTPDALEKALASLRLHCKGDVWCVMGCGGDRDKGKRPLMGEVSSRLADNTVVTSDNPRFENPMDIIDEILPGIHVGANFLVQVDRQKAIEQAIFSAKHGDTVLIAGKGHETYQEVSGNKNSFSDYAVVERSLGEKSVNGEG